jgi:hypothetical protein
MKNLYKILLVSWVLLAVNSPVNAQPEWDDDPIDTPLNGGLSLVIASAIGLGLYSLNVKKNATRSHGH